MASTADSYAALDRRLRTIFKRTKQRIPGFQGYSGSQVASRFMQRCAETSVFEFTKSAADRFRRTGSLLSDSEQVCCGGLLIDGDSNIGLQGRFYLLCLLKYVANWVYAFVAILASLRLSPRKLKLSLLYGVGTQDLLAEGSDARFLHYCANCPVRPLGVSHYLVVHASKAISSTNPARVRYSREPLLAALNWSGLGFRSWAAALGQHVVSALSFIRAVIHFPPLVLLGRDAAYHSIAAALNREGSLQDVMLTTTNYFSQPLWFRALPAKKYQSHIIWYSQNLYPISYVDEINPVPIPNLRYVTADIQWVWSEGFKGFLSGVCPPCIYMVVGPIVWHLPSKISAQADQPLVIALFDVTPINRETENSMGLLRNYYTEENVSRFIKDVVLAAEIVGRHYKVKIEVVLKHKRKHADIHSAKYIATISDLVDRQCIAIVASEMNLYELISRSSLVVAMPYSSPVYLAAGLGKAAFWYDSTKTLQWKLDSAEIPLIQGNAELLAQLLRLFGLQVSPNTAQSRIC